MGFEETVEPRQAADEQAKGGGGKAGQGGGEQSPPAPGPTDWQAKAAENYDLFLRARADYDNLARRTQRDIAMFVRMGKKDILLRLLNVADNLERATSSWRNTLSGCQGIDVDGLVGGVEMIGRQLQSVLVAEGVAPIESVGKPFDPALYECVATWESPDVSSETVTDEIKRGYTINGDVLRASQVRVARPQG